MSDETPAGKARTRPGASADGEARRKAKEARLAKALRANLARRKAQLRGRDEDGDASTSTEDPTE